MRDQCVIERRAGRTFNDSTGEYADVWTTVYAGRCRLKKAGAANDVTAGEAELTLRKYGLDLPWDTASEVKREDRAIVTECPDDSWVIGRPMEVVDVGYTGASTARRLVIEDRS